jgi:hypothetical protein
MSTLSCPSCGGTDVRAPQAILMHLCKCGHEWDETTRLRRIADAARAWNEAQCDDLCNAETGHGNRCSLAAAEYDLRAAIETKGTST